MRRFIGMDVHRDFCEIAIAQDGAVRAAGRIKTEPATLELFAQSLGNDAEVVLEATANALAIARIIEPHVRRVVLANPKVVRETSRRAKTDKIDAKVLAQLLAVGFLDEVWTPDEGARTRRRLISRRCALVRARTREKNQIHAVLQRNLIERPPVSDLFGVKGRVWLSERVEQLPLDERMTVQAGLRQVDFISGEIDQLDKVLGADALSDHDALRLMTLPGVSVVTAIALLGAIGDIRRSRHHATWSPISAWTRGYVNQATSQPSTAKSVSKDQVTCVDCSSRQPGTRPAHPARCMVFTTASRHVVARTLRP